MKKQGRTSNHQCEDYYMCIDNLIANLTTEDQEKMKYVKRFIKRMGIPKLGAVDTITLGPMKYKFLQFILFCFILDYDSSSIPK